MKTLPSLLISTLSLTLLTPALLAQEVSFQFINPPGTFEQAVGISPNGKYVTGGGGSNGFIWSEESGLVTGLGLPAQGWGVSNDGTTMAGSFLNMESKEEAGVWTSGGGIQLLGTPVGVGCGGDISTLLGLDTDGDVAVGLAWIGCRTTAVRWTPGGGLTLMSKQDENSSAKANRVSGDGQVAVGWDQGLPTGQGFNRRACIWTDPDTQIFPATTAANPNGYGEVTDTNSDGSVACGGTQGSAFRWTASGGLEVLPKVPGVNGAYYANGISDDGSIVVGIAVQGVAGTAIIWTPATGAMRLQDFLASHGISVSGGTVVNCTDVSYDGRMVCGWGGFNGSWVVDLGGPWSDLGGGTAGVNGVPTLDASGSLIAGSSLSLEVTNAAPDALMAGWLSLTSVPVPALGGTLYANPKTLQILRVSDATGSWSQSLSWPAGITPGTDLFVQFLVQDASVPDQITLSNAVSATTP